jgi:hypothetical protein
MKIKQNGSCKIFIFSPWFGGDNETITEGRHVEIDMDIEHEHTYKFCRKYVCQELEPGRWCKILRKCFKFNIHKICILVTSSSQKDDDHYHHNLQHIHSYKQKM